MATKTAAFLSGLILGWAMMALFIAGTPTQCVSYPFQGPGAGTYYQPGDIASTYCKRSWLP